jgi:hypothetical protein
MVAPGPGPRSNTSLSDARRVAPKRDRPLWNLQLQYGDVRGLYTGGQIVDQGYLIVSPMPRDPLLGNRTVRDLWGSETLHCGLDLQ